MSKITAEQTSAIAAASKNEIYSTTLDPDGNEVGWLCEYIESEKSLKDHEADSVHWGFRTEAKFGSFAGLPVLCWERVRMRFGANGHTETAPITIIDFGAARGVLPGINICRFENFQPK